MNKKKTAKELAKEEKERRLFEKAENERLRKQLLLLEKQIKETREYNVRRIILTEPLKYIEYLRRDVFKKQSTLERQMKWKRYIDCDIRPSSNSPPELRRYLEKWSEDLLNERKAYFDWILQIDNHSFCSQDLDQEDLTRMTLRKTQPSLGDQYANKIREVISILNEIDESINSYKTLKSYILKDLEQIKMEFRLRLSSFLDRYNHSILCNVERDMDRIDAYSAEYTYKTDIIYSDIFSSRPVPQLAHYWKTDLRTYIKFKSIQAKFACPTSMNFDDGALRGLWLKFDNYSDYAPTYKIPIEIEPIIDLKLSNDIEWEQLQSLKKKILFEMIKVRREWELKQAIKAEEELLRIQQEITAQKRGGGVPDDKKPKVKKIKDNEKEPPYASENTIIDINLDYISYEDELFYKKIENMGTKSMNLEDNEINLRYYRVLGGIFNFNYVTRPLQPYEIRTDFNLTLKKIPYKLEIRDFHETYSPPKVPPELILNERQSQYAKEIDLNNQSKLIEIQIKLPEHVCWWTLPVVCRWEPWEESIEFFGMDKNLQDFHLNYKEHIERLSKKFFTSPPIPLDYNNILKINDFDLLNIPKNLNFRHLVINYIVPRMPLCYKFHCELLEDLERERKATLKRREVEMEAAEEEQRQRIIAEENRREEERLAEQKRHEEGIRQRKQKLIEREAERKRRIDSGEDERHVDNIIDEMEKVDELAVQNWLEEDARLYAERPLFINDDNLKAVRQFKRAEVIKTKPNILFPIKKRFLPLSVNLIDGGDVKSAIEFDLNPNQLPERHENVREFIPENESILLSQFLIYLKELRDNENHIIKIPKESLIKIYVKDEIVDENMNNEIELNKKFTTKENVLVGSKTKKPIKKKDKRSDSELKSKKKRKVHNKELKIVPHSSGKWTNKEIYLPEFNPETNILTFKTGNLGIFGFALPKYINLPFEYWEMKPNQERKTSVDLILLGKKIKLCIEITDEGYLLNVLDPKVTPIIKNSTPINLKTLKKILIDSGNDIFPERDASCYVENIIEKHISMEFHTYYCMGPFSLTHNFKYSFYNHLSHRRIALMDFREITENREPEDFIGIMLTPQKCAYTYGDISNYFQLIKDLTTSLSPVELEYRLATENQDYYPDIYTLLLDASNELSRRKREITKLMLRWNVAQLLCAVRPLSFS